LIVKNLLINGFRNLENKNFYFFPNKNLIHGKNGAGKTSILEAIFMLGFGKSFLNVKKSDIVNHSREDFFVKMIVQSGNRENEITGFYEQKKFSHCLNSKKSNLLEISNYLYPVFFSSSNYNLYIDSKPLFRKMVDRFIFGVFSLYIHYILSYNNILRQKNFLLKTRKNRTELNSWNKSFSDMSEKIIRSRFQFVDKLNQEILKRFNQRLSVRYSPSLNKINDFSAKSIYAELTKNMDLELKYQKSLIGPHRDGYEIKLDSKNLKFYSSGERKINLLKIYIAFIELYKNEKGESPVFLVDDFDTAIDGDNIAFLVEKYPDIQVIATSVNINENFNNLIELNKEN